MNTNVQQSIICDHKISEVKNVSVCGKLSLVTHAITYYLVIKHYIIKAI